MARPRRPRRAGRTTPRPRRPERHADAAEAPPPQPVDAAYWPIPGDDAAGDYSLPVQCPELWSGILPLWTVRPRPPRLFPAAIWEVLQRKSLDFIARRCPEHVASAAATLSRALAACWPLYRDGQIDFAEAAGRIFEAPILTVKSGKSAWYPPREIAWRVSALGGELVRRHQPRGPWRGTNGKWAPETKAYIKDWWHRRADDDPLLQDNPKAQAVPYPEDEIAGRLAGDAPKGAGGPKGLARWLVAKRYGLGVEGVRSSEARGGRLTLKVPRKKRASQPR